MKRLYRTSLLHQQPSKITIRQLSKERQNRQQPSKGQRNRQQQNNVRLNRQKLSARKESNSVKPSRPKLSSSRLNRHRLSRFPLVAAMQWPLHNPWRQASPTSMAATLLQQ